MKARAHCRSTLTTPRGIGLAVTLQPGFDSAGPSTRVHPMPCWSLPGWNRARTIARVRTPSPRLASFKLTERAVEAGASGDEAFEIGAESGVYVAILRTGRRALRRGFRRGRHPLIGAGSSAARTRSRRQVPRPHSGRSLESQTSVMLDQPRAARLR